MLNPQFVAGEHGLFGRHKSEDIRTFFLVDFYMKRPLMGLYFLLYKSSNLLDLSQSLDQAWAPLRMSGLSPLI